jgi:hypothetical protein
MKIRQMRAELFYADGQTCTYDIANSLFSNFCEGAQKLKEGDGLEDAGHTNVTVT